MADLAALLDAPRLKFVAHLEPLAGSRFQPTGFPDLGAATYPAPNGEGTMVLVESAQSMANRLEAQLWPVGEPGPADVVDGLPYVRIESPDGTFLTSSRTESHRLASAYVKAALFDGVSGLQLLADRMGLVKGRPIDHGRVERTVFDLDPLVLVHGVFFADDKWPGQPKMARAVTAFVEASGAREAYSGGVKFDHVSNAGDADRQQTSKEGFGNVPFPRTEYVAERIEASFVVDTSQISRFRLEQRERELLLALALLEIRSLLDRGLRFRTACDLEVVELRGVRPDGVELPARSELEQLVGERIDARPPTVGVFGA